MVRRIRNTDAAIKSRARVLMDAMGEREHWVYAVPIDELEATSANEPSFRAEERMFVRGPAEVRVFIDRELEVAFLEAKGLASAELLSTIVQGAGFYAQSTLLESAADPTDEDGQKALSTLSHMVMRWDDDWRLLFEKHLSSQRIEARL